MANLRGLVMSAFLINAVFVPGIPSVAPRICNTHATSHFKCYNATPNKEKSRGGHPEGPASIGPASSSANGRPVASGNETPKSSSSHKMPTTQPGRVPPSHSRNAPERSSCHMKQSRAIFERQGRPCMQMQDTSAVQNEHKPSTFLSKLASKFSRRSVK